jgi:hypothetical protein
VEEVHTVDEIEIRVLDRLECTSQSIGEFNSG